MTTTTVAKSLRNEAHAHVAPVGAYNYISVPLSLCVFSHGPVNCAKQDRFLPLIEVLNDLLLPLHALQTFTVGLTSTLTRGQT